MKAQSIIDEMKFDVQTKKAKVHRLQANYSYHAVSSGKRWAKGSSGLFKSLIEYYGEVDGKRKWACVIRNKRMELVQLKKKVAVARQELRDAKSVLRLALKHL
jgi:hypothetical protein